MSAQSAIFNPSQTTSAASGDGFSVPRLTTTGRLAISFTTADKGMMVYDTTLNNLFIWTGAAWESVPASGDAGANGSVQYNDNGIIAGAANLQYDKAGGFTSLRSGSALRAYVADNSVYSTISDLGAAGGLTIDNLNSDGISLKIGGVNAYTLTAGVATWFDGAGSTRLTLNSLGNLAFPSAKGIDFSAVTGGTGTATGNVLNDYEEGTFVPTVRGSTVAGTGVYTSQVGFYTKVGRLVTISVNLSWTAVTSGTGNLQFSGLPFIASNTSGAYNGISIGYVNNIATTAGTVLYGLVEFGTTLITMTQTPTGGGIYTLVPLDTAGDIGFSATYFV